MLAGLLLTAGNVIPVTDESMLELTRSLQSSSNKPAFLMYVPEDCQTEACKMMLMFWQMAGTEMPGLVWLVDCNEASTQELCEVARGQIAGGLAIDHGPQIMHWEEEGWKPYRGPRKPEGLLEVMRAAYLAYGLAQGGSEQAAAAVEAETASFETLVKQLEADGPPDAREMAELAAYGMAKENAATKELAATLAERSFAMHEDSELRRSSQYSQLAFGVFVLRWEVEDYPRGRAALLVALEGSPHNVCMRLQLATMISRFPDSEEESDLVIARYNEGMDEVLAMGDDLNVANLTNTSGLHAYNMCLFSTFYHSFYYNADFRECTSKHFRVATKAFPLLLEPPSLPTPPPAADAPRVCGRRLRLGIASGCFGVASHPVPSDFGGMLDRLPREIWEVVYIFFDDLAQGTDYFDSRSSDEHHIFTRLEDGWVRHTRDSVLRLNLDVLLYLDLTMSELGHQVAMMRLAPVTAVSHGHPVSSGIHREALDYYVSWAAAELEPEQAETHYTEKLALLPAHTMHQYYESRIAPDGASSVDGQPFQQLSRADFPAPAGPRWYVCMQKPFKFTPAFDRMLAAVHARDPEGVILLHEIQHKGKHGVSAHNKDIYTNRLRLAGVDLSRVGFVQQQPHHRLMALYSLADVVLDSYHAGGCTTTREALEVGALVVTLPAKYLGSRWSAAYYTIMGVTDLIASDVDDYAHIATRMALEPELRDAMRRRILENVHKLFKQDVAVQAWSTLLQRLAAPLTDGCAEGEVSPLPPPHPAPGSRKKKKKTQKKQPQPDKAEL